MGVKMRMRKYFKKSDASDLVLERQRHALRSNAMDRILVEHCLDIMDYLNEEQSKELKQIEFDLGYSDLEV